ncbi:ACT domain-containing protein [Candidatus Woesearchaeota archaeon]|nr:ACT domain-containing protein [Candidatus Woesearchaeota archaeon]
MNFAKIAEDYVRKHPSIKECLNKDMINYSKLARAIMKDADIHLSFDALLISLRRLQRKIKKENNDIRVKDIMKQSKIDVKSKLVAVVMKKEIYFENEAKVREKIMNHAEVFNAILGVNHLTLITNEEYLPEVDKIFGNRIVKKHKDLVEIIIRSPVLIEHVPGIMSYIYSLFGDHGINILETLSCYTDTILLIEKKDMAKVVDVLNF